MSADTRTTTPTGIATTPPGEAQALAETRAWVDRVVIGLNLCPFAKAPNRMLNSDRSPCTTPADSMRTTSRSRVWWWTRASSGVKLMSFRRGAASPWASQTNSISSTPSWKLCGLGTRTPAAARR